MNQFTVTVKSGRSLDAIEAGDLKGKPIFFIHGTPGSRRLFQPHVEDAKSLGVRLISYSRPGYGNSTRHEGRDVKDAVSDITEIADHLGIEKFAVWGFSGGGPHALACASIIPDRVVAVVTVGGVAPYDAEGLDYFAGTGEYNIEDTKLLQSNRSKWEEKNLEEVKETLAGDKEAALEGIATLLSEVDKKTLSHGMNDYLLEGMREGCSNGVKGLMDDELAFIKPWGFDPSTIQVPVQIWHGKEDLFVPLSHGEWLGKTIKGAETHFFQTEGHLSLFFKKNHEIQKWLSSFL